MKPHSSVDETSGSDIRAGGGDTLHDGGEESSLVLGKEVVLGDESGGESGSQSDQFLVGNCEGIKVSYRSRAWR